MSEGQDRESEPGTARTFDPERGAFAPPHHPPLLNRETNPRGTRHVDETAQDHMAAADRPRYRAAQGRRARMIAAATQALKKTAKRGPGSSRSANDSKTP